MIKVLALLSAFVPLGAESEMFFNGALAVYPDIEAISRPVRLPEHVSVIYLAPKIERSRAGYYFATHKAPFKGSKEHSGKNFLAWSDIAISNVVLKDVVKSFFTSRFAFSQQIMPNIVGWCLPKISNPNLDVWALSEVGIFNRRSNNTYVSSQLLLRSSGGQPVRLVHVDYRDQKADAPENDKPNLYLGVKDQIFSGFRHAPLGLQVLAIVVILGTGLGIGAYGALFFLNPDRDFGRGLSFWRGLGGGALFLSGPSLTFAGLGLVGSGDPLWFWDALWVFLS